jgi:hypothetical protein
MAVFDVQAHPALALAFGGRMKSQRDDAGTKHFTVAIYNQLALDIPLLDHGELLFLSSNSG